MGDSEVEGHYSPTVRLCEVARSAAGSCGFHLTRSKWDPYPWVSAVDADTAAAAAGLVPGDCVLEVNGEDILGEKIGEIAAKVRAREDRVTLLVWNAGADPQCHPESLCCGPMPGNLQRLSAAMNAILLVLECPICLDMIPPPAHQCGNGHLICVQCRVKSERCPVCRMRFTRGRSLLADQVFNSLTDAFGLKEEAEEVRPIKLRERIFGKKKQNSNSPPIPEVKISLVTSPTNKFLTRLLGKSSSVENLSSNPVFPKHQLTVASEFGSNLKAKSLSTGEIFQPQPPVSRSPSVTSARSGNGYLGVSLPLGVKRSASYHGSCESLASDLGELGCDGALYHCPCEPDCPSLVKALAVMQHIQDSHEGPLVQYFKPSLTVGLRALREGTSIVSVLVDGNTFFLKVADQTAGQSQGDTLVWLWMLGSKREAANFQLSVCLKNQAGQSLQFSCDAVSLSSASWADVTKARRGIFLPEDKLIDHFAKELETDVPIQMEVQVREMSRIVVES